MNIYENRLEATVPTVQPFHKDELINDTVNELISKQKYDQWQQQKAITHHENGKIATNIRLDCYQTDDAMYINGFHIMHSKADAKSLCTADSEYFELDTPVIISRP